MGLKLRNDKIVAKSLLRTGDRTSAMALKAVVKGGEKIQELSKKMAPVDKGSLESAIKMTIPQERGINGRKIVTVYVDEDMSVIGRSDKKVGSYATEMHEAFYKPGELSQKKSNANGVFVGRKYLERAAEELESEIRASVEKAAKIAAKRRR